MNRKYVFTAILFVINILSAYSQCNPPASLECESAPVLCSLDELDGYTCRNPDINNPTGPTPLCFGNGVPHNTNWWAFVGNGKFITVVWDFDFNDCRDGMGIQVGIIDNCGGDPLDCNAACNTSSLALSGQTINCHTYYVWVDGCNADVCEYSIRVTDGEAPTLPQPLPTPELMGRACPCGVASVCVEPLGGDCVPKKQWTIDGIDAPDFDDFDCVDIEFSENPSPVEVCVTFTIGNPNSPDAICDQESTCVTIIPEPKEQVDDGEIFVCWENHEGNGYEWRDSLITDNCIDPPCKRELVDNNGCCVEYEAIIELFPERIGPEVYKFFCDKNDLPYIAEDGRAFNEETCGEEIKWQDPNFNNCDTSYTLNVSFFDPKVKLSRECGRCDGFVTMKAVVEFEAECMNGTMSWQGYWLNEDLDTIGSGEEVIVSKEGLYTYVLHAMFVDATTGEVQQCDVEDPMWVIVIDNLGVPDPILSGDTPICGSVLSDYKIENTFEFPCEYRWSVKKGGGTIVTPNFEDTTEIQIQWSGTGGNSGEVCVEVQTDCAKSKETCFEVVFNPAPSPDAGPDTVLCAKDYTMIGTPDIPGGKWTLIQGPGNVNIDSNDIRSDVNVDQYGTYTFVWTEDILTCSGNDTVRVLFNSDPEFGPVDTICGGDATDYKVIFEISGGSFPYTVIEGGGSIDSNNIYTSDTILDNENQRIVIADQYGCFFEFIINHDCVCPNEIGTVSGDTLKECGVTTVNIDYNPTNMVLGAGDTFQFVLYTQLGDIFGSEIESNHTGTFTFDPNTMNWGQVYYMGVTLGKDSGDGFIDPLAGCVKSAEGQPVIWYQIPSPDAGADFEACATRVNLSGTRSIVGSQVKWLNTAGAIIESPNDINTIVTVTDFGRFVFFFNETNEICSALDSVVVIFNESPSIEGVEKSCIDQNLTFEWTYLFNVTQGLTPYTLVSGNGTLDPNSGQFNSNRLKSLERDTVIIEDSKGCRDTLFIVNNCDCGLTKSGTMTTELEQICVDKCVTVTTNNDHGAESDDCVYMILHPDSSNVERGKIIDIQAFDPNGNTFCFDDTRGMIVNQIYYVSYVVGACDPNGDINLDDACFKIISKPVQFIPYPTPDAGQDKDICGLFTQFDAMQSLGRGTWTMVSGPTGGNAIFDGSLPGSNLSVDTYGSYTFRWTEDNGGCVDQDDVTIIFHDSPVYSNVVFECDDVAENYRVTFEVNGGDRASWKIEDASGWTATNIGGNTYRTPWIKTGDAVSIGINDQYDCNPVTLSTSYVCPCLTDPGSLTLNPNVFCVDGVANAVYGGGVEDPNDIIRYYLHDGDANNIGTNILFINATGQFVFDPATMQLNTIYYVTALVGNDDGNGGILLTDRCLGQTPGVPVAWYEDPEPKITTIQDTLTCKIDVIELDGSGSINKAGIGNLQYLWSTTNGTFEAGTDITATKVNITAPGRYSLRVENDYTGCKELTVYDIEIDRSLPTVDPGNPKELTCDIVNVQLDGSNSNNGVGYNVTWDGPGIDNNNRSQIQPNVSVPGSYTLTITNVESGCQNEATVVVTSDYSTPEGNIRQNGELSCTAKEIQLDGAGSTSQNGIRSYNWSTSNGIIVGNNSGAQITIGSPGTYELIVIDAKTGCADTISYDAIEADNTLESIEALGQDLTCFGDRSGSIEIANIIGGFPPYQYAINGGPFSNQNQFRNLGPGRYDLTVKDRNGCELDTFIIITEPEDISIEAKEDQYVFYGDDLSLDTLWFNLKGTYEGEDGTQIYWLDEDGNRVNPDLKNLDRSRYTYTVVVVNKNGCESRYVLNIYVTIERKVYLPNVFAPATDGTLLNNQKFLVFGKPEIVEKINLFQVYSRWGELLYQNDEDIYFDANGTSTDGWDGRFNGRDMNPGVYIYYLEIQYKDLGDGPVFEKVYGDITLLR